MTKAGSPTQGRVTSDWAGLFPEFDVWRPMRLLRRIGPVVQGITLDRSTAGDGYFPTVHVHALTREFPVVSLMLGQRLIGASGLPVSIDLPRHEEAFRDAALELANQSRLPLHKTPSVQEIVGAYHSFTLEQQLKGLAPAVLEMEDSVLISAAAGIPSLVESSLALASELATSWPKARLPLWWEGAQNWLDGLTDKASDVESLSAITESQILKHKLAKVRAA
ncbi:hypothetical protein ACFV9E_13325 [Streptomyces sp. NPDC059835]|uniref:hypothetical protein n=1 Tax=Streptomyces sp. NPDC059835 TaxID=3346967 RepID=UPI00365ED699